MSEFEERTIVIDDEEIVVTEEMVFGGSFTCQLCDRLNVDAVMIRGTLYWICPKGHNNKVVLYE